MKKSILIAAFFYMLAAVPVIAQSLSLSDVNGAIAPNGYVYVWGDSGTYTVMESHISVTNTGASSIDVKLKKAEITVVAGSENSFCWGQCYIPAVFVSPDPVAIDAGVTDDASFVGDYRPKGFLGQTTIRYTFYDMNNVNDSVAVYVVYGATPASIPIKPATIEFSNAFPNPAVSFVSFNYDLQGCTGVSEFVITDLLGGEVYNTMLQNESSKLSVDISGLNAGVYFYSLRVDGKSYFTRKLIIRH